MMNYHSYSAHKANTQRVLANYRNRNHAPSYQYNEVRRHRGRFSRILSNETKAKEITLFLISLILLSFSLNIVLYVYIINLRDALLFS